jgi:hypothetical protein
VANVGTRDGIRRDPSHHFPAAGGRVSTASIHSSIFATMNATKHELDNVDDNKTDLPEQLEHAAPTAKIRQLNAAMYEEALEKYGYDGAIDPAVEKKLVRKLDFRVIPLLAVCYFFYVSAIRLVLPICADARPKPQYVDKTTL